MSETKESLVAKLRDPTTTKGRRGSIVWALRKGGFDCSDLLDDITSCFLEGSFDEVQAAHALLRDMDNADVDTDMLLRMRAKLEHAVADPEIQGWRREAVENGLVFCEPDDTRQWWPVTL